MPIYLLLLAIASITSIIGAICGIGGGVLLKPILDAANIMNVSSVSFLSGCTVLAMAITSISTSVYQKTARIHKRTTPALGVGAAAGGVIGQLLFSHIKHRSGNEAVAGMVQAIMLGLIITGTLVYVVNKDKVKSYRTKSLPASAAIGLFMGMLSSFLGIGGGPVNIAVLTFFFSMDIKEAVTNSLCVILFSQTVSTLMTVFAGSVPEINVFYLVSMIVGGVFGGFMGQRINKRISEKQLGHLFNGLMVTVIGLCVYNALRFALKL